MTTHHVAQLAKVGGVCFHFFRAGVIELIFRHSVNHRGYGIALSLRDRKQLTERHKVGSIVTGCRFLSILCSKPFRKFWQATPMLLNVL